MRARHGVRRRPEYGCVLAAGAIDPNNINVTDSHSLCPEAKSYGSCLPSPRRLVNGRTGLAQKRGLSGNERSWRFMPARQAYVSGGHRPSRLRIPKLSLADPSFSERRRSALTAVLRQLEACSTLGRDFAAFDFLPFTTCSSASCRIERALSSSLSVVVIGGTSRMTLSSPRVPRL